MQHNLVIGRVVAAPIALPILRIYVYFDIADETLPPEFNLGVPEIRSRVAVPRPRAHDMHAPVADCAPLAGKEAVRPKGLNHAFGYTQGSALPNVLTRSLFFRTLQKSRVGLCQLLGGQRHDGELKFVLIIVATHEILFQRLAHIAKGFAILGIHGAERVVSGQHMLCPFDFAHFAARFNASLAVLL